MFGCAEPERLGLVARVEPVGGVRHQQTERGVVEAGLDPLAAAGARALLQREQDADGGIEAGAHVHDRNADPRRGAFAVDAHEPGHRLHHRVVARQAAQGPVRAEAGDAAVDERREALGEGFEAQAPFLHRAGQEILDDDVGLFQQAQHDFARGFALEVQGDGGLVAVQAVEIRARPGNERRAVGARLVALRRLDLDHFRAVVGKDLRAQRAGEHAGQVDDSDAAKRMR